MSGERQVTHVQNIVFVEGLVLLVLLDVGAGLACC